MDGDLEWMGTATGRINATRLPIAIGLGQASQQIGESTARGIGHTGVFDLGHCGDPDPGWKRSPSRRVGH